MNLLRTLSGANKAEVWKQLSEQIHARYVEGDLWHAARIVANMDGWTVTLDTYTEVVGRAAVTYTRLRAPYTGGGQFRFMLYHRSLFSEIAKRLGHHDIETGHSEFDREFVVQADDAVKVRELFADPALCDRILRLPTLHLEVRDDEGWFGEHFPQGVDELCCQVLGGVTELAALRELYDLFAELLHRMSEMGFAANLPGAS